MIIFYFNFRRKYPPKSGSQSENSDLVHDKKAGENEREADDLLLYCEDEECEKNRNRLLSFDAKKYELVSDAGTDENFDSGLYFFCR